MTFYPSVILPVLHLSIQHAVTLQIMLKGAILLVVPLYLHDAFVCVPGLIWSVLLACTRSAVAAVSADVLIV